VRIDDGEAPLPLVERILSIRAAEEPPGAGQTSPVPGSCALIGWQLPGHRLAAARSIDGSIGRENWLGGAAAEGGCAEGQGAEDEGGDDEGVLAGSFAEAAAGCYASDRIHGVREWQNVADHVERLR
jgi:hypothetical protein